MDKISMDFLNDSVLALFGRADFVGGIDNEALDFGQLESFVHMPVINTSSNNGNTSAITLAITAVTTTPVHTITTATASVASSNAPTHGTLPESPPDSGSEPPYSPTDLHAISNLNQVTYHQHQYSTNAQPPNLHHLDQTMHMNEVTNVDCRNINGNTNNSTSSIHKTEDILLSSTALPMPNTVTNMIMPANDMMMHQNTQNLLGLGMHHQVNMGRNNVYRGDNNLLALNAEDDFSCLMSDPMFQMSTNGMSGHQIQNNHQQQQQQTATSHPNVNSYNPHAISQMPTTVVPTSHSTEIPHMLNTRKRTMSTAMTQQNDYNAQSIIENSNEQQSIGNVLPTKRSTSVILPAIKPEPDALSPLCVSTLMEPSTPPSKTSIDACSNVSSCSITSPASTTIMMPSMVESNSSPNLQQQSQGQSSQGNSNENGSNDSFPMQCIRFSPFQQQNWHILCDQSLQELPMPHYRVDADKGFNFSNSDDAFVCQKKNHFQITCHAQAQGAAAIFVRTESGLEKIKSFHLHFYGVKLETPSQTIRVEQSQSDRSKKPFHPVPIDLQSRQVSKITVGRLHFSETTSNNMRKKGRPNPEQRYFQLVVGLHAHTHSGNFPVISQGSERIIVRASNPGQFESDVELCWQRGITQDSIFTHASRVGINTDRPDESLVVHGNLKVSGHIVHPSDSRAKHEIGELDTSQQLQNVKRIRVVKYRYDPEFALHHGLVNMNNAAVHSTKFINTNERTNSNGHQNNVNDVIDTGVIAQEIREVLPDAVQEAGSVCLPSGEVIDNFLLVNKDRIYMENIGAVKELCKVTGSLETRIEHLERMNSRLAQVRKNDHECKFSQYDDDTTEPCSNKMIQITIVVLVIIMAICLAAISTLYFVEHNKQIDLQNSRRYDNEFYLERNALTNTSYEGGGIPGGGGSSNILFNNNGQYWHGDRYLSKKSSLKSLLHNTQNASNAQQHSSQSVVELGPPNAGSHFGSNSNDGEIDPDTQFKSTMLTTTTTTTEQVKRQDDFERNLANINETNGIEIVKQAKLSLSKFDNDVTTEKMQFKPEKNADTFSGLSEPHEASNSINENVLTDVDTNIIDVDQQPSRNGSKSEDKNVVKSRNNDVENRNPHNLKDQTIFESEYHRERRMRFPIGQPTHCESIISKSNRTATDSQQMLCPSFCPVSGHDTAKANQVSDMPEVPEIDIVESSTTFKLQKTTTTKLLPVDRRIDLIEPSTTLNENLNHMSVEPTTAKDKIDSSSQAPTTNDDNKVNRIAIQAEQPVEVRDSAIIVTPNTAFPPLQSNYSEIVDSNGGDVIDVQINQNKPKELIDTNTELRQQELEPLLIADAHAHSTKLLDNDIKPFNKKTDNKFEKSLLEVGVDEAKSTIGNIEPLTPFTLSPQATASTPTFGIPVEASNPACLLIYLLIRSESFNMTLGSDEICHNFNITYNIPISKYMKENRFELVFVTQNSLQWTLCSVKEGNGKENHINLDRHNITDETMFSPKGIASQANFEVEIPTFGDFERQLEFHANLQSSDLIPCRSPAVLNGNPMQIVLYKINIYRDCTQ